MNEPTSFYLLLEFITVLCSKSKAKKKSSRHRHHKPKKKCDKTHDKVLGETGMSEELSDQLLKYQDQKTTVLKLK